MSPRGAPDYSNVRAVGPLHRLDDLSELAARLGSPVTHDREGRIVFIDSFGKGLGSWQIGAYGTGASVNLSPLNFRSGPFSCEMVGGSDGSHGAQISRAYPYPDLNKYGIEFSVMFLNEPQYFIWVLARRDGTQEHQFLGMYNASAEEIDIIIPGGASIAVVSDIPLYVGSGLFHTIKMVVDFENNRYDRIVVNDRVTTITDYEPYTFGLVGTPHLNAAFTLYSNLTENDTVYLDDVIITQAEQ